MRDTTNDVQTQLKALWLNGIAAAWADMTLHGRDATLTSSRWLGDTCCRSRTLTGPGVRLRTKLSRLVSRRAETWLVSTLPSYRLINSLSRSWQT